MPLKCAFLEVLISSPPAPLIPPERRKNRLGAGEVPDHVIGRAQLDERPQAANVPRSEGEVDDVDDRPAALVSPYNRANVCPPLGECLVSVLFKPRAARGARTVPSIRISFAVTLRP